MGHISQKIKSRAHLFSSVSLCSNPNYKVLPVKECADVMKQDSEVSRLEGKRDPNEEVARVQPLPLLSALALALSPEAAALLPTGLPGEHARQ